MPVTSAGIVAALAPNLAAVGMSGSSVISYCRGIANGLVNWVPMIRVTSVDTGTLGVGKNIPLPLIVPNPALYTNLLVGFSAQTIAGSQSPKLILGLTNGLVQAFAQMFVVTTHPSVGTGAGVAKFVASPATLSMVSGFSSAGLSGSAAVRMAAAIAQGLDTTFASLVLALVIVGPSSTSAGAGTGIGQIQ